jgi:hypothetical protein
VHASRSLHTNLHADWHSPIQLVLDTQLTLPTNDYIDLALHGRSCSTSDSTFQTLSFRQTPYPINPITVYARICNRLAYLIFNEHNLGTQFDVAVYATTRWHVGSHAASLNLHNGLERIEKGSRARLSQCTCMPAHGRSSLVLAARTISEVTASGRTSSKGLAGPLGIKPQCLLPLAFCLLLVTLIPMALNVYLKSPVFDDFKATEVTILVVCAATNSHVDTHGTP